MEFSDIVTKSILETAKARTLENSAALLIQRQSSSKAEHTLLEDVINFTANSNILDTKIKDVANRSIGIALTTHSNSPDPHGDRAYTNEELTKHLNFNDPHGNNLYTNQAITTHSSALDPHGDRLFATTAIETHSKAVDPHGDRLFTTTELSKHSTSDDPHGDRVYSFTLMQNHKSEADPHGHKNYTDTSMNAHKVETDPHGINARLATAINTHNTNEDAHNLNARLATISQALRNDLETNVNQKVGLTIAPLEYGVVPKANLPTSVMVDTFSNFPKTGASENALYVDKETKLSYIYMQNSYQEINKGIGGSNGGITTDIVPAGINPDRQYLTRAIQNTINSKLEDIIPSGSGTSLIGSVNLGQNLKALKTIVTEGALQIEDRGIDLVLKTSDYNFEAYYNKNTLLTTDSDILKHFEKDERIVLKGVIQAVAITDTDAIRMIDKYSSWEVYGLLGTTGTSTPIISPSQIVQSSNGIVVTGTGVAGTKVEIYSAENEKLGESNTIESTAFSITLNSPKLNGEKLKLYTVTLEGNRSKPTIHYAHSSTSVRDIDCISISMDGLKVRGKTTRGAIVDLTTNTDTPLGSATADVNGNFTITSSTPLVSNDTVVLIAKMGADLRATETIVVELPIITPVYDIVLNETNTVITGKAEPLSLIVVKSANDGETGYTTSTDSQGNFSLFNYSSSLIEDEYILTVSKDARSAETAFIVNMPLIITNPEPIVKDILNSESTNFIIKEVKLVSQNTTNLSIDLVYNPITKELEIVGKTTMDRYINWEGFLNIRRYKRERG